MSDYVLVNGELTTKISVRDRGLQYGDGLFETIAVFNGHACQLDGHIQRLQKGLETLGIDNVDIDDIARDVRMTARHAGEGVIKLTVTRGESRRGYAIPHQITPNVIISAGSMPLRKTPSSVKLIECRSPVSINPLTAGLKHLNRLDQVMARREVDLHQADDGLMSNTYGHVIEATSANLFLLKNNQLITPDLTNSGIAGIVRDCIFRVASQLNIQCQTADIGLQDCHQAEGILLCNSLLPVRLVCQLGQQHYDISRWPQSLIEAIYQEAFSYG